MTPGDRWGDLSESARASLPVGTMIRLPDGATLRRDSRGSWRDDAWVVCVMPPDAVIEFIPLVWAQERGGYCACGCPMSRNPHPRAGRIATLLTVGADWVCIPCTIASRHTADGRALTERREREIIEAQLSAALAWFYAWPHKGNPAPIEGPIVEILEHVAANAPTPAPAQDALGEGRVREIESRLADASDPERWTYNGRCVYLPEEFAYPHDGTAFLTAHWKPNAYFVAEAGRDLRYLLDLVASLRAGVAERVAVCPECGPGATCDEDRCCSTCGVDLIVVADHHSSEMLAELLIARGASDV